MIDDIEKTMTLVERIRSALPMRAITTKRLRRTFLNSSKQVLPHGCEVTEIQYAGDEGGIVCFLEFGFNETKEVHVVSITHLMFDRRNPLAREIDTYSKHRIKRIKKLDRGIVPTSRGR